MNTDQACLSPNFFLTKILFSFSVHFVWKSFYAAMCLEMELSAHFLGLKFVTCGSGFLKIRQRKSEEAVTALSLM